MSQLVIIATGTVFTLIGFTTDNRFSNIAVVIGGLLVGNGIWGGQYNA